MLTLKLIVMMKEIFRKKFDLNDIGDLLELYQQQGTLKNISLLIYMALRYFSISWREIDNFLQQIGGTRCETAHKWAKIYLTDDLIEFNIDNRGGIVSGSFYDTFPDIENGAKLFATHECQKKHQISRQLIYVILLMQNSMK